MATASPPPARPPANQHVAFNIEPPAAANQEARPSPRGAARVHFAPGAGAGARSRSPEGKPGEARPALPCPARSPTRVPAPPPVVKRGSVPARLRPGAESSLQGIRNTPGGGPCLNPPRSPAGGTKLAPLPWGHFGLFFGVSKTPCAHTLCQSAALKTYSLLKCISENPVLVKRSITKSPRRAAFRGSLIPVFVTLLIPDSLGPDTQTLAAGWPS